MRRQTNFILKRERLNIYKISEWPCVRSIGIVWANWDSLWLDIIAMPSCRQTSSPYTQTKSNIYIWWTRARCDFYLFGCLLSLSVFYYGRLRAFLILKLCSMRRRHGWLVVYAFAIALMCKAVLLYGCKLWSPSCNQGICR